MSGPITFKHKGELKKTKKFMMRVLRQDYMRILEKYAKQGVAALAANTPEETGETADSWDYVIVKENGRTSINWTNSNVNNGVNIAIILQYGHATRNGGWVEGVDYINPAIVPIFERLAEEAWGEVIR